MASYAWILEVRPGYEELYKLRHDAIWRKCWRSCAPPGFTTTIFFGMA
jgi:L-rhamnose mutarotase